MILPETGRGTAPERRGGGGSTPRQRPEVYQARKLRKEMSLPEAMLWKRLRRGSAGAKFRRQHPIGPYVADFCCLEARLVVEVDGEVHGTEQRRQRDAVRDSFLAEKGFEVLRVAAVDVLRNADGIAHGIAELVTNPLHHPSDGPPPRAGEEL